MNYISIDFSLHWLKTKAYYFDFNWESGIIFTYWDLSKDFIDVRLHSSCFFSEIFWSDDCDCNEQLMHFIEIMKNSWGVLIYLFQEWRGQWIKNKFLAYGLSQKKWLDTKEAYDELWLEQDVRNYIPAVDLFKSLISTNIINLHTNNPRKTKPFLDNNFIINRESIIIDWLSCNASSYLKIKQEKLWHYS